MTSKAPGVVLSVDDNQSFAHLIPRWLSLDPDLHHAAHLPSAAAMLEFVALLHPQVVVLDLHMPGADPIQEMRKTLKEFPGVCFVVLADVTHAGERAGGPDRARAAEALAAGASCVIDKARAPAELAMAVRRVLSERGVGCDGSGRDEGFAEVKPRQDRLCSCGPGGGSATAEGATGGDGEEEPGGPSRG